MFQSRLETRLPWIVIDSRVWRSDKQIGRRSEESPNVSVEKFKHDDDRKRQANTSQDSRFFHLAGGKALARSKRRKPDKSDRREQKPEGSPEEPEHRKDADDAFEAHTGHRVSVVKGSR